MTTHYIISGKVQGIGFRRFALHHANRLGLTGFVCNLEDGNVECVAQGSTDVLSEFELLLRQGPHMSTVTSVECTDVNDPRKYKQFRIV